MRLIFTRQRAFALGQAQSAAFEAAETGMARDSRIQVKTGRSRMPPQLSNTRYGWQF